METSNVGLIRPTRRQVGMGLALLGFGLARSVRAAAREITVGAIVPMSGPWARPGILFAKGAELAVRHINAQGGVRIDGGAMLKLVQYDAGDSPEASKNAAQRMVAEEPDMVAAAGAWLSIFTLPASEVTERARLPLVTSSSADKVTERGFRYVFRTAPKGAAWVGQLMPGIKALAESANGRPLKTVAIIADSTPAALNWADLFRSRMLPQAGIELLVDETFTPPIADATLLVQKVRRSKPDLFLNIATSAPDSKLFVDKMSEMKVRVPTIFLGTAMSSSEVPSLIFPDALDGSVVGINNWGTPERQSVVDDFDKFTDEPFMGQESSNAYADMWLIKLAIERAGAPDREKIAEALRSIDLPPDDRIARLYFGGRLKFDEKGDRVGAGMMLMQWQGGKPVIVYPPEMAGNARPIWRR